MPAETPASEELRRYEIKWGTYKSIGVALVSVTIVGIFSAFLNWQIQDRRLEVEREQTRRVQKLKELETDSEVKIKELNQQQEYLTQFTSFAMNENLQSRIDFAQYVSQVATDENLRKLWKDYHTVLEKSASETRADLKATRDKLQALLQESEEVVSKKQFEIDLLRERIASFKSQLVPSYSSNIDKFYSTWTAPQERVLSADIIGNGYQLAFTSRVISSGEGHWKYLYEVANRGQDEVLGFSIEEMNISMTTSLPPGSSTSWTHSSLSPPYLIDVTLRIGPNAQQTHIVAAYAPGAGPSYRRSWITQQAQ